MSTSDENRPEPPYDEDGTARRDFLKKAATGAAAAAGGLAFVGGQASAAQPPTPPAVGAEIPCSCLAPGVPLTIETTTVQIDFSGQIKVRVESSNPLNPWSLKLKVIGHEVTGTDNGDSGEEAKSAQREGLGRVHIKQSDAEVTPESLLEMTQQSPPKFEQTMFLDFTMTIENPPQQLMERSLGVSLSKKPEPLVLATKNPGKLVGHLNSFPPEKEVYQLQNPIELVVPDQSETIATIDRFPVQVGSLDDS
ncbi:twin-arginine translocation signal domain-containing protein [Actinopolyspora halophila]|uniref:twin-arginine translocation signal domain-containing protein n=1 Tax=Actinopolyspora halophila TaxID=1850 RepID=UPI00035CE373|nr:twin-arginine translocation signal domain-containing protein [Actinopolyspora halophila]